MVIGLSDEEDDGGENDDLNVHNLIGTSQNDISEGTFLQNDYII